MHKLSDVLEKEKYIDNKEYAEFARDPNAWSKPDELKKSRRLWDEATYQMAAF